MKDGVNIALQHENAGGGLVEVVRPWGERERRNLASISANRSLRLAESGS